MPPLELSVPLIRRDTNGGFRRTAAAPGARRGLAQARAWVQILVGFRSVDRLSADYPGMLEVQGYGRARLYDGSWVESSADLTLSTEVRSP
jgi:hypothetical protein